MFKTGKQQHPCVYSKRCDLGNHFKTCTKNIWIASYCNGEKQASCKRRSFKIHGLKVPENLLPNGSYLEYKKAGG